MCGIVITWGCCCCSGVWTDGELSFIMFCCCCWSSLWVTCMSSVGYLYICWKGNVGGPENRDRYSFNLLMSCWALLSWWCCCWYCLCLRWWCWWYWNKPLILGLLKFPNGKVWDRCQRCRESAKRGEAHRKTMSSLYCTHNSQTMLRIGFKWTTRHNLQSRKHYSNLSSLQFSLTYYMWQLWW